MRSASLTPREKKILKLRFGLVDGHEHSIESLGLRFGVSPERIAEICEAARKKLRALGPELDLRDILE